MSLQKRRADRGLTLLELLIVVVILGIIATVTVYAVRGVTDDDPNDASNKVTSNSLLEWAASIAPVPANEPTMTADTWAHVIQAGAAGNLDFNVLHSGRDNLGREMSTGDGYSVAFTRVALGTDYKLRVCPPQTELSMMDVGSVAMVSYIIDQKLSIDPPTQPVMAQVQGSPHPFPHAFTVHLTATSDEEAGQQMIGLFQEIADHPLGCPPPG